jgi:hypothetical protein
MLRDLVDDRPGVVAAIIEHDDYRERVAADRLCGERVKARADAACLVSGWDNDDRVHAGHFAPLAVSLRSSFRSGPLGEEAAEPLVAADRAV